MESAHLKDFSVVVENEKWKGSDSPDLSAAKLVAVEVYGYTLILQRNQIGWISVSCAVLTWLISLLFFCSLI